MCECEVGCRCKYADPLEDLLESRLAPFELSKVIGFNLDVGVKLLTEDEDDVFLYSMGHLICRYNITNKQQKSVSAHDDLILAIECDLKAKFMITSDKKCAIIWDLQRMTEESLPILRVFLKPFGDTRIAASSISPSGKYILLMSAPDDSSEYLVQLWSWSFERTECDASGVISKNCGQFKNIRFGTAETEDDFFVITFSRAVAFSLWNSTNGTLKFHIPEKKNFQDLNASCYVTNSRFVVSVTSRGLLVVWSDLHNEILKKPVTNEKEFAKSLLLRKCSINDVKMVDHFIATVDSCGEVRFYDNEIRLMYHCSSWSLTDIRAITPSLTPRKDFQIEGEKDYPRDYTLETRPFIIRNFAIITNCGQMFYCDAVKNTTEMLPFQCAGVIVATDHQESENAIIVCSSFGRISYFHYKNFMKIADYNLDDILNIEPSSKEQRICTTLKLSPFGCYLGLGFNDGLLCIMDPIIGKFAEKSKPMCFSKAAIERITFGKNNLLAYTDRAFTVVLATFGEYIQFIGKYRFHCAPIVGTFFTIFQKTEKLVTIGEDRFLVEYGVQGPNEGGRLEFLRDVRLEQSAKITVAALLPSTVLFKAPSGSNYVILIANDEYKLRFFDSVSLVCMKTVLGPLFESPIRQIILRPVDSSSPNPLLILASRKTLGSALFPLDGNPFRFSGVMAHYSKITNISTTKNANEIFVQGEGDCGGTIWELKVRHVIEHHELGGEGLAPFCTLLPGGKEGWLFKEMQNFFIYIQLLSASLDAPEEFVIKDAINLPDLVDYLRAVGYFPSEWEIKTLKSELTTDTNTLSMSLTKISFSDIVKIYINHKPIDGYKLIDISNALQHVSREYLKSDEHFQTLQISLDKILELLTEKAETVPRHQAIQFLIELLESFEKLSKEDYRAKSPEAIENIFKELFSFFNTEAFCKTLLGIEIDSSSGELYSMFGNEVYPSHLNNKLNSVPTTQSQECLKDEEIESKVEGQII